jgi:hypothetical protein
MSVFGAPGDGFTIYFGPKGKKGRRDEYEDDSGMDSEEDDPAERQRKKRLAKKETKAVGRPKAAVERRLAEGGASSWHHLFESYASPYKRLVYGKNWSNASSAALNQVLSSNNLSINKAAALWLQYTNKPNSSIPPGALRTFMTELKTDGDAEALLACVALSHAAEAMPAFAEERATAALDSIAYATTPYETPFHWEMSAGEREEMWSTRANVATQQLAPSLKTAANAVQDALRTGNDAHLHAVLASIAFPNL